MLKPAVVQAIAKKVYKQFPETAGSQPRIRAQKPPQQSASADIFLLTFHGTGSSNGQTIPRVVRVVADENGRILKITTSR